VTIAWFHCFSGIAGDMALGSLIDAGADLDEVKELLGRLPVSDWTLESEPVCGIAGNCTCMPPTPPSRTASHIQVAEARLPRVQQRAAALRGPCPGEGRRPPDQVHGSTPS
jgi:hypothetical protein